MTLRQATAKNFAIYPGKPIARVHRDDGNTLAHCLVCDKLPKLRKTPRMMPVALPVANRYSLSNMGQQ
jgi:hypothetical protein